jgi:hypothetical protein
MPGAPEPSHDAADAALALLAARYRVTVDETPGRGPALDPPPPPDAVRVVRLVPDGTDGESLTVVLTVDGGTSVHVRRSRVLELAPDAPDHEERLAALAERLAWTRR